MTTPALLKLHRVRVEDAAEYLQNATSAEEIRIRAINGVCSFCTASRKPGRTRYRYCVNVGALIKEKWGDMTPLDIIPQDCLKLDMGCG